MLVYYAVYTESGRHLLKQRSRKSRHSGEMFSGMGGGPLLLAMWNRADTCMCIMSPAVCTYVVCAFIHASIQHIDVFP